MAIDYKAKYLTAKAEIVSLTEQLEAALARKNGLRSPVGVHDRYSDMEAPELRELVIKRGGDPDEIAKGFHSRARSIKLREWLRATKPAKSDFQKRDAKEARAATNSAPAKKVRHAAPEPEVVAPVRKAKRVAKAPEPAPKPIKHTVKSNASDKIKAKVKRAAVVEAPAPVKRKPRSL